MITFLFKKSWQTLLLFNCNSSVLDTACACDGLITIKQFLIPVVLNVLQKLYFSLFGKAGFHFGEFGRATKQWDIWACVARNLSWKQAFTGKRAASSGSYQNEQQPIRSLLLNAWAYDRIGSGDRIRRSENKPLLRNLAFCCHDTGIWNKR